MNRTQLLQHFETLADTPEAVAKLRRLLLDLAVRGRLVPQATKPDKDPTWQKLCRELDEHDHDSDVPSLFEIPSAWRWVMLDRVAEPCGQKKPDARFTYVDVGAIVNVHGIITADVQVLDSDDAPSRARKLVQSGLVIYSTVRPYLRNIAVVGQDFDPPAIVSTAFAVLHPKPLLDSRFLFHWLRSGPFQDEVAAKMKGVAYPAISDSEFWERPIPLPPPEEQKRLVAKVEELLALCDALEARQTTARKHRARLVHSALDHLASGVRPSPGAAMSARTRVSEISNARHPRQAAAPGDGRTPDDFRRHIAFVLSEFPELTAAPEDVPALRQAILSLAVQGRLVPQDKNDEPAIELLRRRSHLWKPSKAATASLAMPFELPPGWVSARCEDLCNPERFITYGVIKLGPHIQTGVPVLRSSNVRPLVLDTDFVKCVSPDIANEFKRTFLNGGEILVTVRGPLGGVAVAPASLKGANISREVAMLPLLPELNAKFFALAIASPIGQTWLSEATQGIAYAGINIKDLKELPIAIPPLAEQQRIVAKVEELMRWCDQLEAHLAAARTTATHFLDATVRQLLAA